MTDHYLSGAVSDEGHLVQYGTFRYHGGIPNPSFRLSDWYHSYGWARQPMRIGLRNPSGTQVTNTLQWNYPGDHYAWKTFSSATGSLILGNLAMNVRTLTYQGMGGVVNWSGVLRLT